MSAATSLLTRILIWMQKRDNENNNNNNNNNKNRSVGVAVGPVNKRQVNKYNQVKNYLVNKPSGKKNIR
jgi:hypothetical protein